MHFLNLFTWNIFSRKQHNTYTIMHHASTLGLRGILYFHTSVFKEKLKKLKNDKNITKSQKMSDLPLALHN